jgi:type IV secretory pathway VirJ component
MLLLAALAPARASAAEDVHYTKETLPQFEQQLRSAQIQAATFNRRVRSMRLTLKNGEHVLVIYKAKQSPELISKLQAKRVPVTVLSKAAAEKEAKEKPVHHKIRYIAGGVLVALIVIIGAVLIFYRRRQQD